MKLELKIASSIVVLDRLLPLLIFLSFPSLDDEDLDDSDDYVGPSVMKSSKFSNTGHQGNKIPCPVCNKEIHESSLKRHIRTMHEVEGYMDHEAGIDDNQNMSDENTNDHMIVGDQIMIADHPITLQSQEDDTIIYYHNKQSNRKHAPGNRVSCPECQKPIHPSSLSRHLADIHNKGTENLFQ